jgi:hypothetical protein
VNTGNSSASSGTPEAGSPKALAVELCNAVIANDTDAFMNLIITQEEMTALISGSAVSAMGKEAAISNIPTEISKMRIDITNGLAAVRQQCEANGAVWENTKYKDARFEINNPNGYNMMQLHCILECNSLEYIFTLSDVVETKNGWKLGGTMFYGEQPAMR